MGLRCLLGHDFTEPRTERDREERGDEVIISIREVKECRRCGEQQVVSENKEVTSMEGLLAETGDESGGSESGRAGDTSKTAESELESGIGADDSPDGIGDATPDTGPSLDVAEAIEDAESGEEFDHPKADPQAVDEDVEDDAEIIEDEPGVGTSGDGRTEWAEADATHPNEANSIDPADLIEETDRHDEAESSEEDTELLDQTADGEDAESTASHSDRSNETPEVESEDATIIDADTGQSETGEDGQSTWPEHDDVDQGYDASVDDEDDETVTLDGNLTPRVDGQPTTDPDTEYVEAEPVANGHSSTEGDRTASTESRGTTDAGFTRAERRSVELSTTVPDPELEYYCPECGLNEPVGDSSMRAGDICPECKQGYVSERTVE